MTTTCPLVTKNTIGYTYYWVLKSTLFSNDKTREGADSPFASQPTEFQQKDKFSGNTFSVRQCR